MADPTDPIALNVIGVTDLVQNKTNKVNDGISVNKEGVEGDKYGSLELNMDDAELLKLRDEWESKYAPYETKHKLIVEKNLESYLGKKANGQWLAGDENIAANLQFEAEETFLASALSKNPEPVVYADNTPEGNKVASDVKTLLGYHGDQLALRRKTAVLVRQWSINHLAVFKHGWNSKINDIAFENRKIADFIFDPHGYVDAYGNFVGYLGERIKVTAKRLIELFSKHKEYIEKMVDNKLGTEVIYTEWWSADNTYTFTTFKDKVLDKNKNQYFKYEEPQTDALGNPILDEMQKIVMMKPRNHFANPEKPYTFLSVFSLQEQPHDITGLIEQNIPNQKLITKRTEQIDYNVSASNNGYAYSEDNFNQETAKQAANARRKGNPILIPQGGPIDKAIMPLSAQDLPAAFFNELEISKNDLRTSWGVQGITSQPQDEDQTARGMILNQAHDTTRIGGGIGNAIEQVIDNVFNWWVQLYYVFYDERHFAVVMGNAKAVEFITLSSQDLDRQLIVSVAPDSLRPRDEVTEMNLAQALFDKGAIGPKTLLKMLDFPNPDEAAADGVLYKIDPMAYLQLNFPDFAAKMQQLQMQNMAQAQTIQGGAPVGPTPAPEGITEPNQGLSTEPASAALANVQLPQ